MKTAASTVAKKPAPASKTLGKPTGASKVAYTMQEQKPALKVEPKLTTAQMVDRLSELHLLLEALKPTLAEFNDLKKQLIEVASSSGDADSQYELEGDSFKVVFTAHSRNREIASMTALMAEIGLETFLSIAHVNLTDVDKYVSKTKQEETGVVRTVRGKRSLSAVVARD